MKTVLITTLIMNIDLLGGTGVRGVIRQEPTGTSNTKQTNNKQTQHYQLSLQNPDAVGRIVCLRG